MSFTYDLATLIGKVRLLISDTSEPATFTDEEISVFLAMASDSIYVAAAIACETQLAKLATTSSSVLTVKIGEYSYSAGEAIKTLQQQAQRFRELENTMPAFDVAEENLSTFNELQIIKNYVMRTEV